MRRTSRFKPVRAGVIHVWDYSDEVFHFADGRLVLRGANGSGKTKALEVLVPFVLDGRLDARRLDPFSGEERTMKSNLLYRGGSAAYGYCWMEFGRRGEAGEDEHVTIGAGLRAQEHKSSPDSWFFVAEGIRGRDFDLLDDERRPHTQRALTSLLGRDSVYEQASEYRRAVDQRLFGLGIERYEAMLELMIALRRPHLAKDLDEGKLSEVLTEGLRPLDDELLGHCAVAFEDLEQVQAQIQRLERADSTLQDLLVAYRTYLRTHAKARLDAWRSGENAAREAEEALSQQEGSLAAARDVVTQAKSRQTGLRLVSQQLAARIEGLRRSDAYAAVAQLDDLREHVVTARNRVDHAEQDLRAQAQTTRRLEASYAGSAERVQRARLHAESLAAKLSAAASMAGISWAETDAALDTGLGDRVKARFTLRRGELDAVFAALVRFEEIQAKVRNAHDVVDKAADTAADARERAAAAEAEVARERAALHAALDDWALGCTHDAGDPVTCAELHEVVAAAGTPGAQGLEAALRRLQGPLREMLAGQREALRRERAELQALMEDLRAQIAAIQDETDDAPPPLRSRPAAREGRAGAPLWRVVRFAEGLTPAECAGVEGALEAAGLLDAWIDAEPRDRPDQEQDGFLLPTIAPVGATLADVLVPDTDGRVGTERVTSVLRSIALDGLRSETSVVDRGGRFRLGVLHGTFVPDEARYIGAAAREANRRRRIGELQARLNVHEARWTAVQIETTGATARAAALDAAVGTLPKMDALERALRLAATRHGAVAQAEAAELKARETLNGYLREAETRKASLLGCARQHDTAADRPGLEALRGHVTDFGRIGEELVRTSREADAAQQDQVRTDELLREANQRLEMLRGRCQDASGKHAELLEKLQTIEEQQGPAARELLAEIERLEGDQRSADSDLGRADEVVRRAELTVASLDGGLEDKRKAVTKTRAEATATRVRLEVFQTTDLARALEVAGGFAADEFPTRLEGAVGDAAATEERRKATRSRLEGLLNDLEGGLGSEYRSEWRTEDEIVLITVEDADGRHGAAIFAKRLADRLADQRQLLTIHEQAIFEDQLLGSLCAQLHDRILEGRALVRAMDAELKEHRLSSGLVVSIGWAPTTDDDVADERRTVLKLLDRDAVHLGPQDFAQIRAHFAERVKSARRDRPTTPFSALLREVLDYRQWHAFQVRLRELDGTYTKLTKGRYSQLSGGEKAACLHLPLFAAANAHFTSGSPICPRLIALDEAFAGIDARGTPELLALTVAFDLDLFLTGFDLWVVEPCIPAVAHYDLCHDKLEHVVSALLILWNGTELVEGDDAPAALAELAL